MAGLLDDIFVILVRPKFPENIGMAARACANMGCPHLRLVEPAWLDLDKARRLATHQAESILNAMKIYASAREAVEDMQRVYATTARLGGWRRACIDPAELGLRLKEPEGLKTGLLFGPEDRGLSNEELAYAADLIHIPAAAGATSLNLAQSALLTLYAIRIERKKIAGKSGAARQIAYADQLRLEDNFKAALLALHCLHGQNPEYFFQQWRQMLRRLKLRPHEYAALMGLCRQIRNSFNKEMPNETFSGIKKR